MVKYAWFFFLFLLPVALSAQLGGSKVYRFLSVPASPRTAALGGSGVAVWGADASMAEQNPALLHSEMHQQLVLNYVDYFARIPLGQFVYVHHTPRWGTFSATFHSINYGEFIETDPTGLSLGEFRAADSYYQIGWGFPLRDDLQVGAHVKFINSNLERYYSHGLAADVALLYHPDESFSISLIARNMGYQLRTYYTDGERESLPFEMELAASKKLEHAPFRIHASYQHLNRYNLLYDDPDNPVETTNPFTGEVTRISDLSLFFDNLTRHFIVGAEFIPSKNFYAALSFNAQRRAELTINDKSGFVGISWGVGVKVSKFNIAFARSVYHLAGGSNHFSLSVNLASFYKKKSV